MDVLISLFKTKDLRKINVQSHSINPELYASLDSYKFPKYVNYGFAINPFKSIKFNGLGNITGNFSLQYSQILNANICFYRE